MFVARSADRLNLATGSRSIVSLKSDFCKIAETCSAIAALVGKTDVTVWSKLRSRPVPALNDDPSPRRHSMLP